ncbi:FGGY-family carbohydrate kinase [Christensenella timonensis]|uniref:FGGY-family carbohydrate kinase n=1 Tax=Christensenella timonensis TaxID=1816678 RepID=UPI00082DCA8F|nr:FGGY family carbohydrate kinase [Christensenella timonensis]
MAIYLMGVDIGTTGTKAMIFDLEARVMGTGYRECIAATPEPDWFEFDAEQLIERTFEACREAVDMSGLDPREIKAVSFSTQRSTVGFIGEDGKMMRNVMYSWQDNRATEEVEFQKQCLDEKETTRLSGMPVTPTYCISNILWFKKHYPEEYEKAKVVSMVSEFLAKRFGADDYYCDWGNASCSGIFDMQKRVWSEKLITAYGLDAKKFPKVVKSGTVLGRVSGEAAALTGLSTDTLLIAGSGDQSCGALGAGIVSEGLAEMTIGTAGHLISYIRQPLASEHVLKMMTVNAAVPGNYELNGIQLSAASVYRWLRDVVATQERDTAKGLGMDPYVLMDELVRQSPPGANGLILLPYFASAGCPHWDVEAKGVLAGLTFMHTKGDMARAFMEGCMYEMREIMETMREAGVAFQELRITGGATKSALWRQIMADILGLPLRRLKISDATVLGAAILAGYGAGVFASPEEGAAQMVKCDEPILPDQANVAKYNRCYGIFQKLYAAMKKEHIFALMNGARE